MHVYLQRYFGLILFFAASLQANEFPYVCHENACCVEDFQLHLSILALKASCDQNSYVISSTNNRFGEEVYPDGDRHLVSSKFRTGVRVESLCPVWPSPCNILNLRFTYFQGSNSNDTSGPYLFDTVGYPGNGAQYPEDTTYAGTAKMHHHYRYYSADSTLNRPLLDHCFDNLTLLFGLHYTYIKFREKFLSTGIGLIPAFARSPIVISDLINYYRTESSFWGIGPELGVNYNYLLPCFRAAGDFGLNINMRGVLLASSNDASIRAVSPRTGPNGVNVKNKHAIMRLNPACLAQLGFNYTYSGDCCTTFFEIGYEFNWYSKCINKITSYDIGFAGDTFDAFEDLCLQGPFVRFNILY